MKKILPALFFALCSIQVSAQVSAQKEAQEFPWSKAAKIIAADEAKAAASKPKKPDPQLEAETKKREKAADAENKKSK
ncbi:hypothetical protein [Nitrosospira sp. Is2]|uniref:hypothetical protein n=1 Tax=Nitrosospira sp. Is2 TaxID=3080532 RepID=UPI0029530EB0|nr:hypothetical protein [Nitrosospira sp. Is2]WON75097.1 hypothetical protein R5L00_06350 [Nitrosospira sp. Is2]